MRISNWRRMSVEEKRGSEALAYLNRLGDTANSDPAVLLVRARALALTGRCADAGRILGSLEGQAGAGPGMSMCRCAKLRQVD
jgi:hypothetical protein